jgi:hypothetical protein
MAPSKRLDSSMRSLNEKETNIEFDRANNQLKQAWSSDSRDALRQDNIACRGAYESSERGRSLFNYAQTSPSISLSNSAILNCARELRTDNSPPNASYDTCKYSGDCWQQCGQPTSRRVTAESISNHDANSDSNSNTTEVLSRSFKLSNPINSDNDMSYYDNNDSTDISSLVNYNSNVSSPLTNFTFGTNPATPPNKYLPPNCFMQGFTPSSNSILHNGIANQMNSNEFQSLKKVSA